jgi:putative membrane protein
MTLLLVWILNAVALLAVAYILPGIVVASFGSAMWAALVLYIADPTDHDCDCWLILVCD